MGSDRLSFPIISRFPTFGSSLGVAAAPSVLVKEPKEELEELDMRPPVMETSRNVIPAKSGLKNLSQWGSHLAKVLIGKHG